MSRNTRTILISCSTAAALLCLCATLIALALLSSCHINKPIVASGLPDPDKAFRTPQVHGYWVYVWECHEGKRISIHAFAGTWMSAYERQEAPCGQLTPIEQKLANERLLPLDPKQFWK